MCHSGRSAGISSIYEKRDAGIAAQTGMTKSACNSRILLIKPDESSLYGNYDFVEIWFIKSPSTMKLEFVIPAEVPESQAFIKERCRYCCANRHDKKGACNSGILLIRLDKSSLYCNYDFEDIWFIKCLSTKKDISPLRGFDMAYSFIVFLQSYFERLLISA